MANPEILGGAKPRVLSFKIAGLPNEGNSANSASLKWGSFSKLFGRSPMHGESLVPGRIKQTTFLRNLLGSCVVVLAITSTSAFADRGGVHHKPLVYSRPAVVPIPAVAPLSPTIPIPNPQGNRDAEDLTLSLLDANARHTAAGPADRGQRLAELVSIARTRHDALVALIDADPAELLRASLTTTERASFPPQAAAYLEEDAQEDGELQVYHTDHVNPALSDFLYFLKTAHGKFSLHFAGTPPALMTGAKVRVNGVKIDNALVLDNGGTTTMQQLAPAPVPNAFGEQQTLLILVNFQDNPAQPYTVSDANTMMFGTTSNFFRENSYQQTWLNGIVVGWFTIPSSSTVCDTFAIASQAESAAVAAGVNLAAYAHRVYAFPQNYNCYFWGRSSVGGNPSQTWINGDFKLGVTAHELGHALGLWHSHSTDCGADTLGANCTAYEYGDTMDMMGASSFAHFNPFQKERLGWLNAGVSPPIATVTTGGTYFLENYETAGSGPKALKILKSTDPSTGEQTWYYVHFRQAIGFDAPFATNTNILNGVLIHFGNLANGNSSALIDLTPSSGGTIATDWSDPALTVGQSFADSTAGVTMTTASVTGTSAAVTIALTGTGATPTSVSVSTDKPSYSLNQTVSIKATVTSDGSPVAKAKVTFKIKKSNGALVTATATTATDGVAVYKLRLSRKDPVGVYEADADTMSSTAATNFTVQ
jgi:Gametolysin peptidase M11